MDGRCSCARVAEQVLGNGDPRNTHAMHASLDAGDYTESSVWPELLDTGDRRGTPAPACSFNPMTRHASLDPALVLLVSRLPRVLTPAPPAPSWPLLILLAPSCSFLHRPVEWSMDSGHIFLKKLN
jgi:hypothetical protein